VFFYGSFCHGALKLDISTIFTTFFLRTSLQFILYRYLYFSEPSSALSHFQFYDCAPVRIREGINRPNAIDEIQTPPNAVTEDLNTPIRINANFDDAPIRTGTEDPSENVVIGGSGTNSRLVFTKITVNTRTSTRNNDETAIGFQQQHPSVNEIVDGETVRATNTATNQINADRINASNGTMNVTTDETNDRSVVIVNTRITTRNNAATAIDSQQQQHPSVNHIVGDETVQTVNTVTHQIHEGGINVSNETMHFTADGSIVTDSIFNDVTSNETIVFDNNNTTSVDSTDLSNSSLFEWNANSTSIGDGNFTDVFNETDIGTQLSNNTMVEMYPYPVNENITTQVVGGDYYYYYNYEDYGLNNATQADNTSLIPDPSWTDTNNVTYTNIDNAALMYNETTYTFNTSSNNADIGIVNPGVGGVGITQAEFQSTANERVATHISESIDTSAHIADSNVTATVQTVVNVPDNIIPIPIDHTSSEFNNNQKLVNVDFKDLQNQLKIKTRQPIGQLTPIRAISDQEYRANTDTSQTHDSTLTSSQTQGDRTNQESGQLKGSKLVTVITNTQQESSHNVITNIDDRETQQPLSQLNRTFIVQTNTQSNTDPTSSQEHASDETIQLVNHTQIINTNAEELVPDIVVGVKDIRFGRASVSVTGGDLLHDTRIVPVNTEVANNLASQDIVVDGANDMSALNAAVNEIHAIPTQFVNDDKTWDTVHVTTTTNTTLPNDVLRGINTSNYSQIQQNVDTSVNTDNSFANELITNSTTLRGGTDEDNSNTISTHVVKVVTTVHNIIGGTSNDEKNLRNKQDNSANDGWIKRMNTLNTTRIVTNVSTYEIVDNVERENAAFEHTKVVKTVSQNDNLDTNVNNMNIINATQVVNTANTIVQGNTALDNNADQRSTHTGSSGARVTNIKSGSDVSRPFSTTSTDEFGGDFSRPLSTTSTDTNNKTEGVLTKLRVVERVTTLTGDASGRNNGPNFIRNGERQASGIRVVEEVDRPGSSMSTEGENGMADSVLFMYVCVLFIL